MPWRSPLASSRDTRPLAEFSHPRIRKMAHPAFLAIVAHAPAFGPNVAPRPLAPQGPPNWDVILSMPTHPSARVEIRMYLPPNASAPIFRVLEMKRAT